MKLAWLTDIHLDHLHPNRASAFYARMQKSDCDAFLITGDISVASRTDQNEIKLIQHLRVLATAATGRKVYFVLGNHDFWYSGVDPVRAEVKAVLPEIPNMCYLTTESYVKLSEDTALVGHDCWYDAMNGKWQTSGFRMIDWIFMHDYLEAGAAWNGGGGRVMDPDLPVIVGVSRGLAVRGVNHIEMCARAALADGFKKVLVASHIPPFEEAHIHEGKQGDDAAQPWFTSGLLGDLLVKLATEYPTNIFVSFSGHTHGPARVKKMSNLHAHVGGARYGYPEISELIDI